MKRALFIAHVDSFHRNFNIPYIRRLQHCGYEVSIISSGNDDFKDIVNEKVCVSFARAPIKLQNIKALLSLHTIFYNTYYDLIYIATPIAGAICRIALFGVKRGRVVYSAHGYSFYKGNSKLLNYLYRFIEKILSRSTDCIFTMNKEDYNATIRNKFNCREVYNVNGVGIDTRKFEPCSIDEKEKLRLQFGYSLDLFILIYPAELSTRKNQIFLLCVLRKLIALGENKIKLLLLGSGNNEAAYKKYVKENMLEAYVEFLGYRNDVYKFLRVADVLFASSLNEGLPINMIEALSSGLPVVASRVRGHVDLIEDGYNGFLFGLQDEDQAIKSISMLKYDRDLYKSISHNALESSRKYDITKVINEYDKIWGFDFNNQHLEDL